MKRVVVTGMGLVTPFGCGKSQNWNSLISAKSGAAKIQNLIPRNTNAKLQVKYRSAMEKMELLMQKTGLREKK